MFETQHDLVEGEDQGTRTWTYLLTDQSAGNIREVLQSPLVEDTFHINPTKLRVELDLPEVPPWERELLQREWLPYGALLLGLIGVALAWTARHSAVHWSRTALAKLPAVLRAVDRRIDTLRARQEVLGYFVLCALFLFPMLRQGPTDDEELALGFFSGQVYYRDLLLHGRWSYWLNNVGFGTPMPLGHRLDFHPVFGLGSLISLRVAVSALWIVQIGVMAVFFRRLLVACGVAPGARLLFFGLYLFSLPRCCSSSPPTGSPRLVPWTLYPVLVYYLRDAVMGGVAKRWWLTTVRLALLFGVWVLDGHPGYLVPLLIVLAVYGVAVARPSLAVYGALAAAGGLAVAISAERIYFLVHEMSLFPKDICGSRRASITFRRIWSASRRLSHI